MTNAYNICDTYGLDNKAERYAVRPRHFLGEVEHADHLVRVVRFELFPRNFLHGHARQRCHRSQLRAQPLTSA